jgi:hypothetical protein
VDVESPAVQMVAQWQDSARNGPTPGSLTAPVPRRSPAFPASAQSLRARARGRRRRRRGGRSIGRAWRAKARRANPNCGRPALSRWHGALEGFLRGPGVSRVALEQDFGARPMQFGFERPMAQAARIGEQGAMHRLELAVKDGFVAGQRAPSRLKTGRRNMKRRRWPGEREFRSEISANF